MWHIFAAAYPGPSRMPFPDPEQPVRKWFPDAKSVTCHFGPLKGLYPVVQVTESPHESPSRGGEAIRDIRSLQLALRPTWGPHRRPRARHGGRGSGSPSGNRGARPSGGGGHCALRHRPPRTDRRSGAPDRAPQADPCSELSSWSLICRTRRPFGALWASASRIGRASTHFMPT